MEDPDFQADFGVAANVLNDKEDEVFWDYWFSAKASGATFTMGELIFGLELIFDSSFLVQISVAWLRSSTS